MEGLVYNTNENAKLQSILDNQRAQMEAIDKGKNKKNEAVKYIAISAGIILALGAYLLLNNRK